MLRVSAQPMQHQVREGSHSLGLYGWLTTSCCTQVSKTKHSCEPLTATKGTATTSTMGKQTVRSELQSYKQKSDPSGLNGHIYMQLCRADIADKTCEIRFSSWVSTGKSLTCTADLNCTFCNHSAHMRRGVLHVAWVWNMHRDCQSVNKRTALLMVKEDFVLML